MEVVDPGVSVHGFPEKLPAPLVVKLAEPPGADFVPESVSETSTVQLVLPFTATVAGEQPVTDVDVDRVVMLKVLLVAPVKPLLAAVNVYPVPVLLIDRSLNVATPLEADAVVVPLNVPEPGFVPIATVIDADEPVTTFPLASSTDTCSAGLIDVPATALEGCMVNANFVAAPDVMLNVLLVAPVKPVLAAVKV